MIVYRISVCVCVCSFMVILIKARLTVSSQRPKSKNVLLFSIAYRTMYCVAFIHVTAIESLSHGRGFAPG